MKEKKQGKVMSKYGYNIDNQLSNDNQQVYYNPNKKKLLVNIAGTHNLNDVGTDLNLALGNLKNTKRYKEADLTLQKAKDKYNENKVVVTGHSLGGSIGKYISKPSDEVYTLNSGSTIGEKKRPNQHNYKIQGDIISTFANGEVIPFKNDSYNIFKPHGTDAIKDQMIFI